MDQGRKGDSGVKMHTIVLCNGVFDLLHPAHVRPLQAARRMGTLLVVGVTRDSGVNKPGRPIMKEEERLEMVRALSCVYSAYLCQNSLEALDYWKPTIFCKGADYLEKGLLKEEIEYCKKHKIEIKHTNPHPLTTTSIIERIKCASA